MKEYLTASEHEFLQWLRDNQEAVAKLDYSEIAGLYKVKERRIRQLVEALETKGYICLSKVSLTYLNITVND